MRIKICITHKRVESIEEIPKLKLYENNRKLIWYVSRAYYSWEVQVFTLISEFFQNVTVEEVYLSITCKNFNMVKMYSRLQQTKACINSFDG
jgi:hypothetical protein